MSDKDLISPNLDELIRRRDAMEAVETEENLIGAMDSLWDGSFKRTKRAAVRVIAGVPAVPQEMSAREYLLERNRLCRTVAGCDACPIFGDIHWDCEMLEKEFPQKAVAIVEKWALEHPEERSE